MDPRNPQRPGQLPHPEGFPEGMRGDVMRERALAARYREQGDAGFARNTGTYWQRAVKPVLGAAVVGFFFTALGAAGALAYGHFQEPEHPWLSWVIAHSVAPSVIAVAITSTLAIEAEDFAFDGFARLGRWATAGYICALILGSAATVSITGFVGWALGWGSPMAEQLPHLPAPVHLLILFLMTVGFSALGAACIFSIMLTWTLGIAAILIYGLLIAVPVFIAGLLMPVGSIVWSWEWAVPTGVVLAFIGIPLLFAVTALVPIYRFDRMREYDRSF